MMINFPVVFNFNFKFSTTFVHVQYNSYSLKQCLLLSKHCTVMRPISDEENKIIFGVKVRALLMLNTQIECSQ